MEHDLKIFSETIEPQALNQVYTLLKQPAFQGCKPIYSFKAGD